MIRKICEQCGNKFMCKPSRKETARFCSLDCRNKWFKLNGSWNKGLTKQDDSRIKPSLGSFKKGSTPWNVGIKRTDRTKKKISLTKKKRYASGETKLSPTCFKKGDTPHNKGKTKENYEPLEKTSEKMKGRKITWKDKIKETHWSKKKELRQIILDKMHTPKANLKRVQNMIETNKKLRENDEPNSYEKKICDLCLKYNLPFVYTGNSGFWIRVGNSYKNPDFINKEKKIAIEVFNNYHKIRDYGSIDGYERYCEAIYGPRGWEVIFINEAEISSKVWEKECLNKIQQSLKGGKKE